MKTFAYYNYQFGKRYDRQQDMFADGARLEDPERNFERKQQILRQLLQDDYSGDNPINFVSPRGGKLHRHKWIAPPSDDIAIMKISNRRRHHAEDADFNEVESDEYQSAIVIIDNREGVQRLLVEMKKEAFSNPQSVAGILELSLGNALAHYNLGISIDQLHLADAFWNLVNDRVNYPNGFRKITFKFPHLNLDRLRSAVAPLITTLRQDLDSDLVLTQTAPPGSSLPLAPEKESLSELVNAATEVIGGNVIKLYPSNGKAINVGEDNYRTAQIDSDIFEKAKSKEPEEVQRALDLIKTFTKRYI